MELFTRNNLERLMTILFRQMRDERSGTRTHCTSRGSTRILRNRLASTSCGLDERGIYEYVSGLQAAKRDQVRHHIGTVPHPGLAERLGQVGGFYGGGDAKMDKKLHFAQFRTENKKQTVFDSEGPNGLRFGIPYKQAPSSAHPDGTEDVGDFGSQSGRRARRRLHRSGFSSAPWSLSVSQPQFIDKVDKFCNVTVEVSQPQFSDKVVDPSEQMPQAQILNKIVDVRVVTQRQIPVQRVQKRIEFSHAQHLTRQSMFLFCGSLVCVTEGRLRSHGCRSSNKT